ncbi:MAG TPA: FecR family protein [Myxococcaceae bacterium]|nr:FecR family protein [Myxococcaceae bacterium]
MKGWLTVVGRMGMVCALLVPTLALASIGKVALLEGKATRKDASGQEHALAVGSELELRDTLSVGEGSNVKLVLTDESVMMLGARSQIFFDEATFEGQVRKGFSAKLLFGRVWAKVKQMAAGSDAKFEVTTERAVAGVRGTIFRVDYGSTAKGVTATTLKPSMVVRVVEGRVVVQVPQVTPQQPPSMAGRPPPSGTNQQARTQVAPPQEITAQQWTKLFANLQAGQEVEVTELGVAKRGVVKALNKKAMQDDFGQFVDRNQ